MDKELINAIRQVVKEEMNPINKKLNKMDNKIESINNKIGSMDSKMDKLESQQKKNTERLETIFEQTGKLTVGQADIYTKLEDISENIDYLTTKEAVNEREISKLKKRAQ